jgi:hypothetical protein
MRFMGRGIRRGQLLGGVGIESIDTPSNRLDSSLLNAWLSSMHLPRVHPFTTLSKNTTSLVHITRPMNSFFFFFFFCSSVLPREKGRVSAVKVWDRFKSLFAAGKHPIATLRGYHL